MLGVLEDRILDILSNLARPKSAGFSSVFRIAKGPLARSK